MQEDGFRGGRRRLAVVLAVTMVVGASAVSQAAPSRGGRASGGMPVAAHARLTLRSSEYGKVIFDAHGRVLYLFAADHSAKSTCYGVCAAAWPPMLTKGAPTAGPGLNAKLVGTTKRRDGSLQVTYNGHPLYYYSADMRGKIMCQHANMHGGFWFVVKANGTPNTAKSKSKM